MKAVEDESKNRINGKVESLTKNGLALTKKSEKSLKNGSSEDAFKEKSLMSASFSQQNDENRQNK
jgi:hypothetical protein